jgi:tetratricopeptide (TPR) repeat protein
MNDKIELYQEVLTWEPNSKVFFPLARLLVENGRAPEALTVLREGLARNPDFLEARLLLIELLDRAGAGDEATRAVSPLAEVFGRYPGFWQAWALSLPPDQADFSVALGLAGAHLAGTPLNWSRIIEEGFKSLFGRTRTESPEPSVLAAPQAPQAAAPSAAPSVAPPVTSLAAHPDLDLDLESPLPPSQKPEGAGIRTRTMADLLASQGDFPGAADIYRELQDQAATDQERAEITARLAELHARMESEDPPAAPREPSAGAGEGGFPSKNKLIKTLERLAARLEARAGG